MPEWRPVPGWPCEVSDDGQIKGPSGKILKPYVEHRGHLHVLIRHRKLRIHHAVLLAFVGPRNDHRLGRHLNDVPDDNRVSNLAWGSYLDNADDARRLGNVPRGEAKTGARLTAAQVEMIRHDTRASRIVGVEYGVSHTAVLRIRRGDRWRES